MERRLRSTAIGLNSVLATALVVLITIWSTQPQDRTPGLYHSIITMAFIPGLAALAFNLAFPHSRFFGFLGYVVIMWIPALSFSDLATWSLVTGCAAFAFAIPFNWVIPEFARMREGSRAEAVLVSTLVAYLLVFLLRMPNTIPKGGHVDLEGVIRVVTRDLSWTPLVYLGASALLAWLLPARQAYDKWVIGAVIVIGFAIDARTRRADREAILMWVIIATIAVNIGFARNLPARSPVRAPDPAVN